MKKLMIFFLLLLVAGASAFATDATAQDVKDNIPALSSISISDGKIYFTTDANGLTNIIKFEAIVHNNSLEALASVTIKLSLSDENGTVVANAQAIVDFNSKLNTGSTATIVV